MSFNNSINEYHSSYVVKKKILLIGLFFICMVMVHLAFNVLEPLNRFGWLFSCLIWLAGVFIVRKSTPVIIVYVFFITYITVPYYYFFLGKQISVYGSFQSVLYINEVAFLNSLFLSFLSLCLVGVVDKNIISPQRYFNANLSVFILFLLPCIYSILFGTQGESLLESNYGSRAVEKSALHEYFLLFFFFLLISHNPRSYFQKTIVFCLLIIYSVKTILYGGRVEVIQSILLYIYLTQDYLKNINKIKILFYGFAAFFVFSLIGFVRGSLVELLSSQNIDLLTLMKSHFFSENTDAYVVSTSADIFYASMRILGMIDNGIINLEDRIVGFFLYLFNSFVFSDDLKLVVNLSTLLASSYPVGGGGLIHTYFYAWLGYFGVIFSAVFIGLILRRFHCKSNRFVQIYGFFILITFPRWWGYSPINFTKMIFFAFIIFLSIDILFNSRKKHL